jgi:hypothetical protein
MAAFVTGNYLAELRLERVGPWANFVTGGIGVHRAV